MVSCYKCFINPASIKSTTMNSRLQRLQESPEQSRDETEISLPGNLHSVPRITAHDN
jgi:hypothetical protein